MSSNNIHKVRKLFANSVLIPEVIKMLEEGHSVTLPLRGFSMRPFLEDERDMALLTKPGKVKIGDPVLAEIHPGAYVLHRIVAIQNDDVTLRGDGNLGYEYCTLSDIKASVIGFYRKGSHKLDRIEGWKWRTYSRIWLALSPFRRYLLGFYRRVWVRFLGPM